jgi:hypothetical protein
VVLHLSNNAEALSITFIGLKISGFVRAEAVKKMRVTRVEKKVPDSIFPRVSIRRITNIVSQTRGLNHSTDVTGIHVTGQLLTQHLPYSDTQRATDTTNLQTVCQTGMDVIIFTQRVNLSLSVEATKSRRKNDAVVVFMEWCSATLKRKTALMLSKAHRRKQTLPAHCLA